ncbi:hypothetical protein EST38_g1567 [Candolleomyces aberdarensis]|uniref:Uncharacterized protein n=1 Tax=Candolleomyces aberdarensis TaxID=2316362 RepID=A0A4Q2DUN8_9AGAR|nr:hypothetical protein EST38_g1567 [Candolleomyces aberdarensis]
MKFLAVAAALISVIPAIAGLVINTPTGVVTCQPMMLSYGQGTPPYYVSILPGGQVSGTPYHTWPATDATSMTWVVDLPGGTAVSLVVKDGTGAQAYSDAITIQPGSDSSCLNGAAAANSSAAATASHPASSGSAAAAAATHAASAGGTPATAGGDTARPSATQSASSNAASGGASSSSTNSAAQLSYAAYGVGGAVGLVGALLL